eukprot:1229165-Pyramimonas_sp.AAC.1
MRGRSGRGGGGRHQISEGEVEGAATYAHKCPGHELAHTRRCCREGDGRLDGQGEGQHAWMEDDGGPHQNPRRLRHSHDRADAGQDVLDGLADPYVADDLSGA